MEVELQNLELPNVELIYDVLIKIFDFLSVEERKPARLVCQSWNRILTQSQFKSKAWFVLENCFISDTCPPWTIIRNMVEPITNLRLGENISYNRMDELVSPNRFFNEIAPHLTRLFARRSILLSLPMHSLTNLMELTVDDDIKGGSQTKVDLIPPIPESVEILCFDTIQSDTHIKWFYEFRNFLRSAKKNLKQLKIARIILKRHEPDCFLISTKLKELVEKLYEPYFGTSGVHLSADIQPKKNFLYSSFVLEPSDIIKLKKLPAMNPEKLSRTLSDLLCMTNLKSIHLEPNREGPCCFFTHDSQVSMRSIRSVKITPDHPHTNDNAVCTKCLENLAKSCPFIGKLSLSLFNPPQMEAILDAFKDKLTKLTIYIAQETHLPMMRRLRAIKVNSALHKDVASLYELCSVMPNVVDAEIYCPRWKCGIEELEVVGRCWPNLKYLKLTLRTDLFEEDVCRTLQENFRCLIHFDGFYGNKEKVAMKTFKKIPTLRKMSYQFNYGTYCQNRSKYE